MSLIEIVAVSVIVIIVGGAIAYIVREKKKGKRCVGCPYAKECSAKREGGCTEEKTEQ